MFWENIKSSVAFFAFMDTATESTASPLIVYNGLAWERSVYRAPDRRMLFSKTESDARLHALGMRSPKSREVFGLIRGGLEGELSGEPLQLFQVIYSSGEWFHDTYFETRNGKLIVTEDGSEEIYSIEGMNHGDFYPLRNFAASGNFVERMYSVPFASLPQRIQNESFVYLSFERGSWPVSRGVDRFVIINGGDGRTSRGVRDVERNSS